MSSRLTTRRRCIAKHNPRWGVIARAFYATDLAIDTRIDKALCGFRVQQQMVDAEAGVAFPPVSPVIPKCVHRRVGMHGTDGVDPALTKNLAKQRPRFRLHKRIVGVGLGRIDVGVGRHDIKISGQYDRRVQGVKLGSIRQKPFHPGEYVLEFRPRLRVTVGRVDSRDENAVDSGLDIPALRIFWIARQLSSRDYRLTIPTYYGDAIPRLLPAPDGAITGFFDCRDRKFGVYRLQFLKARNIRPGSAQPAQEIGKPLFEVIDVEGSNFHLRD